MGDVGLTTGADTRARACGLFFGPEMAQSIGSYHIRLDGEQDKSPGGLVRVTASSDSGILAEFGVHIGHRDGAVGPPSLYERVHVQVSEFSRKRSATKPQRDAAGMDSVASVFKDVNRCTGLGSGPQRRRRNSPPELVGI